MPVLYVENARDNVAMHIRDTLDIEPVNKIRNIRGFSTFVTNFFVREGVGIGRGKIAVSGVLYMHICSICTDLPNNTFRVYINIKVSHACRQYPISFFISGSKSDTIE